MWTRACRAATIIILIPFLFAVTSAQESPRIQITAVSLPGKWSEEQSAIIKVLTNAFEAKRAVISYQFPEWTLVINALTLDSARYVVSWVLLEGLPETTVQFAKENEVFYLSASQEQRGNFSPEGKVVREGLSEEFIRQYGLPVDSQLFILKQEDLSTFADKLVQDFFVKFFY